MEVLAIQLSQSVALGTPDGASSEFFGLADGFPAQHSGAAVPARDGDALDTFLPKRAAAELG